MARNTGRNMCRRAREAPPHNLRADPVLEVGLVLQLDEFVGLALEASTDLGTDLCRILKVGERSFDTPFDGGESDADAPHLVLLR
jgi:hypothetical protein